MRHSSFEEEETVSNIGSAKKGINYITIFWEMLAAVWVYGGGYVKIVWLSTASQDVWPGKATIQS